MNETIKTKSSGLSIMKLGMIICCTVMLLPIMMLLSSGAGLAGLLNNWGVFLPLTLCLGMHFVMHKFMGKSCHSDHENHTLPQGKDAN